MRRITFLCSMLIACDGRLFGSGGESDLQAKVEERLAAAEQARIDRAEGRLTSPVVRLSNREYNNTLAALFPTLTLDDLSLPPEQLSSGYDNNAYTQSTVGQTIEQYGVLAETIADRAAANLGTIMSGCNQAACGRTFIESFAKKAYRRNLTDEERTALFALFDETIASDDFEWAVRASFEAILTAPQFLYRVEIGTPHPTRTDRVVLTSTELASRLSYFLWESPPDDTLLAANLTDTATLEAEARRLLADPRAKTMVAHHMREWLRFDKLQNQAKDLTIFPFYTVEARVALFEGLERYVDEAFWSKRKLSEMLTATEAYVNDASASIYDLPATGSSELQKRPLDPTKRSGLLTQAAILSGLAHDTEDAPVARAMFVLDRLLCAIPPPPPAGINTAPPPFDPSQPRTTRQRFEEIHQQGTCGSCHRQIDGIGFTFSHFDAVGRYRATENGLPIDASTTVSGAGDVDGEVEDVLALSTRLAQSQRVAECFTFHWLRRALAHDRSRLDLQLATDIAERFVEADGDMPELLVAIATSPKFKERSLFAE